MTMAPLFPPASVMTVETQHQLSLLHHKIERAFESPITRLVGEYSWIMLPNA